MELDSSEEGSDLMEDMVAADILPSMVVLLEYHMAEGMVRTEVDLVLMADLARMEVMDILTEVVMLADTNTDTAMVLDSMDDC